MRSCQRLGKAANVTKQKVSFIELDLKDALKRVSTQIKTESQAAILRIRIEFERNNSGALRDVATSRAAVLYKNAAEISRSFRIRLTRWLFLMQTLPFLSPGRLITWSQTSCSILVLKLVVLRTSNEVFLSLGIVCSTLK